MGRFICIRREIQNVIGRTLESIVAQLRGVWEVTDPDERIEGSGEAYLDPAHNPRYTLERRLQDLEAAKQEDVEDARESLGRRPY